MQSALHQHARAAEGYGLVNSLLDLLDRVNVGVRLPRSAVERAKRTDDVADVRVIDVSVNDVGDQRRVVLSLADLVCRDADPSDIAGREQRGAVFGREPLTSERFI